MTRAIPTGKVAIGLMVVSALLLVAAANWHLVDVAIRSQPECLAHIRPGEAARDGLRFGAARSACTPVNDASPARTK
jgi:hypothetical protein